jgi:hypothetical protein
MYLQRTQNGLNPRGQQPQSNLQTTTVRSFEGGLNVSDTDLNMSPKFARILDNMERQTDGSLALRPGTRLFSSDLWDVSVDVINHTYFNGYVIAVQVSGAWTKVDGAGNGVNMSLIAAPAGTRPWTNPTDYASFAIFGSDLIGVNGKDKPIIVKGRTTDPNYMEAQYLVDEASGSNINTPIGKYVVTFGQYLIIAGVASDPSTIFISARGTSGTFFGDAAPNDGVNVDLGPRVSLGSSTITGLVAYRDKLLVTFERGVIPLNLGIYTGDPGVHTPSDDGFIQEFGCLCHRSLVSVGDDTFFNDNIGVNSINRVNVFNTLRPVRASHLIDPLTTASIQPLSEAQIQRYMFAIYDLRNFRYMLFVPVFAEDGVTITETVCYSYTNIPTLKVQAWARLRGWKWQSACRTSLQNIIFSRGDRLYSYDFDNQSTHADRLGDPDVEDGEGEPIAFDWELPWADMKHRMNIKQIRYLALDTTGTAKFTVRAYVDNIHNYHSVDSPLLSMQFTGGSAGGYGDTPYGDGPYGGGRRSSDERLYAFVAKFKILKLRFSGSTRNPLRFVSISLGYIPGSIRR